ncbi:MAG: hypothetical protein ACTHLR_01080 [Rhizomicrobium sp.]
MRTSLKRFVLGVSFALIPLLANADTSPVASHGFDEGRLSRVRALHDPLITGDVPTYYTPGYLRRSRQLQKFISGELRFYERTLHVDMTLSLAVIDKKQWPLVEHQIPYSIPSVTGTPPVALMAANWGEAPDFFPKASEVDPALVKSAAAHGVGWIDASHSSMDLVGGHELGHALADAYGIVPGTRWLNEMLATYYLYAYLQSKRHDLRWLIDILEAVNRDGQPQRHVSLDDFENQYMTILTKQPENYGWYQAQFLELTKAIYAHKGLRFLDELRKAFPGGSYKFATLGNAETLRRLDAIDPQFRVWAAAMSDKPQLH